MICRKSRFQLGSFSKAYALKHYPTAELDWKQKKGLEETESLGLRGKPGRLHNSMSHTCVDALAVPYHLLVKRICLHTVIDLGWWA